MKRNSYSNIGLRRYIEISRNRLPAMVGTTISRIRNGLEYVSEKNQLNSWKGSHLLCRSSRMNVQATAKDAVQVSP